LSGAPLRELWFDAERITKGLDIIRQCKTVERINGRSPDEFWREFDGQDETDDTQP